MAPIVKVPANFGRKHIGSWSHDNLKLKLKEGKELRANSMILSLNSPVIDDMTTNLGLKSVDVDDFSESSVNCFIDAMYTGDIEKISKAVFRDVNKMGHVFDVSWLTSKCSTYFITLVGKLCGTSISDTLFAFEEAQVVDETMKRSDLLDAVVGKISGFKRNNKRTFILSYMDDFTQLTTNKLDLMIKIAGKDCEIVVQSLVTHLAKHAKIQGAIWTDQIRYLLENTNMALCRKHDVALYTQLFDALERIEDVSTDNVRLVLRVYRESSGIGVGTNSRASGLVEAPTAVSTRIPNLFHNLDFTRFGKVADFYELYAYLSGSPDVGSLYMFVEGLYCWMDELVSIDYANDYTKNGGICGIMDSRFPGCQDTFHKDVYKIKESRGWTSMASNYLPAFSTSPECIYGYLCMDMGMYLLQSDRESYQLSFRQPNRIKMDKLVLRSNTLFFMFRHPKLRNCTRQNTCGLLLETTPFANKKDCDTFDIRLCVDEEKYLANNFHFHDDIVKAENIHLTMEQNSKKLEEPHGYEGYGYKYNNGRYRAKDGRYYRTLKEHVPVTWQGKPVWNETVSKWKWGRLLISDHDDIVIKLYYNVMA